MVISNCEERMPLYFANSGYATSMESYDGINFLSDHYHCLQGTVGSVHVCWIYFALQKAFLNIYDFTFLGLQEAGLFFSWLNWHCAKPSEEAILSVEAHISVVGIV